MSRATLRPRTRATLSVSSTIELEYLKRLARTLPRVLIFIRTKAPTSRLRGCSLLYICIPAFDEAPTVGLLLWRIRKVFQEYPREY